MPLDFLKRAARFATSDGGSIKARVLRSGFWVSVSNVGLNALNMLRSVFLARLLNPEIFGLMGLAFVVLRATDTFTRPGVAQALIARQKDFDEAAHTAFTMLVIRGFLLAAILAGVAPWVADFYDKPQLMPMLQILSLVFVLNAFANINTVARQRELDFRSLTYLAQVTNFVGTAITIAVAFWLRNVWALVIGQLVQAALNTALSSTSSAVACGSARPRGHEGAPDLRQVHHRLSMITYICAEPRLGGDRQDLRHRAARPVCARGTISSLVTLNLPASPPAS